MVLFEVRDGVQKYMKGDDDSSYDYNAKIIADYIKTVNILSGQDYILLNIKAKARS